MDREQRPGDTGTDDAAVAPRVRRRDAVEWGRAVTIALGVAGGLLLSGFVGATAARLRDLIVLLAVCLFLSFGMEPAVQWLHKRGVRRGVGTALVFGLALVMLGAFALAMAALVGGQLSNLVANGPDLLADLGERVRTLPEPVGPQVADLIDSQAATLPSRVDDIAASLGRGALGVGTTVVGGVIDLLTVLLVTFYVVADGPRLRRTLSGRLEPARQRELLEVWDIAIEKTGGYVYSRLLTAAASGAVHVVAFTALGLPYPIPLGLWVGIVSSLIPVVGTYLAGALPLTVALATEPLMAVWVGLVIVVYQQVENYLVGPRITEATLALHPAIAFLSVLVGAALLGAPGALLALPVAAIVAALVSTYGERHEVMEHGLTADEAPPERGRIWEDEHGRPRPSPVRGRTRGGADAVGPAGAGIEVAPAPQPGPQTEGSTTTNVDP